MSSAENLGRLREEIQAGHRARTEFVTNLMRTVADLRKGFIDENQAAHAAWFGPTRAQIAVKEVERVAAAAKKKGKPSIKRSRSLDVPANAR